MCSEFVSLWWHACAQANNYKNTEAKGIIAISLALQLFHFASIWCETANRQTWPGWKRIANEWYFIGKSKHNRRSMLTIIKTTADMVWTLNNFIRNASICPITPIKSKCFLKLPSFLGRPYCSKREIYSQDDRTIMRSSWEYISPTYQVGNA